MTPTTPFLVLLEETTKDSKNKTVRTIRVHRLAMADPLYQSLAGAFRQMSIELESNNPVVSDFHGQYTNSKGELSRIPNFPLPTTLQAALKNPAPLPILDLKSKTSWKIKAIALHCQDNPTRILFQAFRSTQIVLPKKGWSLFDMNKSGTLTELDTAVLSLGPNIDAIYDDGTLLFYSFDATKTFLDLSEYFRAATSTEMASVLSSGSLVSDDLEGYIASASIPLRKKFFIIQQSDVLNEVNADTIYEVAITQGLVLELRKHAKSGLKQVVIPEDKQEALALIDLLCQARYLAPLTGELRLSNSSRPDGPTAKKGASATPPTPQSSPTKKAPSKAAKKAGN